MGAVLALVAREWMRIGRLMLGRVGIDAFAGELTRGNIGTILATIKIENTQRYREVLWLGGLDSNQD
ncbi:MAG: hypothetical protein CR217_15460 [Beijerinckiaceae bacterium]|nr:MAG: hypothetical protein CR217_15460 [Beijerinckiaceae bacterium]